MRKTLLALSLTGLLSGLLAQPALVFADDTVIRTETHSSVNPVAEIVLFPVRLVGGAVGAPVGAVAGLFTGFVKGFNFVGDTDDHTTVTTRHEDDDSDE
ncbi:MAG: hypothetical protein AB7P76_05875 [Candidatus Melainabacteria bacterium]